MNRKIWLFYYNGKRKINLNFELGHRAKTLELNQSPTRMSHT
jgi:hypothetical protein